jgi:hypothetical protein
MSSRKRKTQQATKRSTARSIVNAVKFFSNLGSSELHELGTDEETFRMQRQEALQRQVDNFWGLDKDLKDRNREISFMYSEDLLSRHVERDIKILAQHRRWDHEFQIEDKLKQQREKDRHAYMRVDHLRLINSPISVEDLLQSIWHLNSATAVPILPQIASLSLATNSVANIQGPPDAAASLAQLEHMQESIATLGSMRMSLHLEGLQQTREIINQASGEFKQVLKDLKSGLGSQDCLAIGFNEGSVDTFATGTGGKSKRKGRGTLSTAKFQQIETELEEEKKKKQAYDHLYNDAVEGHGTFHWDQEQLLHHTFQLLDTSNKGYLTREELASVSFNPQVHDMLQFTVLWSVIKKKEWVLLEDLLRRPHTANHYHHSGGHHKEGPAPMLKPISRAPSLRTSAMHQSSMSTSSIGSAPSTHSNSQRLQLQREQQLIDRYHHPPKDTVPYTAWFELALSLSREPNVQIRHIRTIEEHVHLSRQYLQAKVTKKFRSDHWSSEFCGPVRDFRAMRQLRVGDCVWVLHRKGVRWLPAVIEHIHYPYQQASPMSPNIGSSHSVNSQLDQMSVTSAISMNSLTSAADIPRRLHHQYCTYDVYFPLNQEELNKSRLATTSRQLLSLPSEQLVEDGMLPVRPFPSERSVCSYAFDLVDVDALGVVELDVLIAALQSPPMLNIVSTSLVLSAIFQGEVIIPHLPGVQSGSGNSGSNTPMKNSHSRQPSGIFGPGSSNQPIYVGRMKRQSQTMLLQQKREREKERIRQKMREKLPWWQRTDSAPARPSFITVFCDTFAEITEEDRQADEDVQDVDSPRSDDSDELSSNSYGGNKDRHEKEEKKITPCISKVDFLEFCDSVNDIVRFDLPSLHHHVQQ